VETPLRRKSQRVPGKDFERRQLIMVKKRTLKILVPLDGSDRAFECVKYISRIEPFLMADIHLLHIANKIPETYFDIGLNSPAGSRIKEIKAWESQTRNNIHDHMDMARNFLKEAGFSEDRISIHMRDRKQGIARDIVEEARLRYDAVVIGRKGIGRLKQIALGGVAAKLLEKLRFVPLCLVGRESRTGGALIAVDGSEGSMKAVKCATRFLGGEHQELELLHVIRGEDEPVIEESKRRMEPFFREAIEHLSKTRPAGEQIHQKILTGSVSRAEAIFHEAENGDFATIFMGRRGLSRVREFFMGRVSNKVVQLSRKRVVWVVN
jgi:nucleotide-binding universal stress UspA family protein